jgi:hypothetical protein
MSSTTSGSDATSEASNPTPEEHNQSVDLVTNWIAHLDLDRMAPSVAGSTTGGTTDVGPKVNSPQEFTGNWRQFSAFKMQCMITYEMQPTKFDSYRKRLLFAVSYLRGPAYDWVQPHLEDYLGNTADNRRDETKALFENTNAFFAKLGETFGQGNERMEAERDIRRLRQNGPAAKYKAEFQTLAIKTGWNDAALADAFYLGLKENVKDEIARQERPRTQTAMFELAIRIDTRLHERQMEKKGHFTSHGANTTVRRAAPKWRNDYYGPQPMELDATRGQPRQGSKGKANKGPPRQQKNGERKPFDKSKLECHNCGQKGHFARECAARKQQHELRKQEQFRATTTPAKATAAATRIPDHAEMVWTSCYDDDCPTHLSDKEGSGWYPHYPKAQSVCVLRGTPTNAVVPTFGPTPEESSDEDYEVIENSSSEDDDEENEERWAMPPNDAGLTLLRLIRSQWAQACPWIDGVQHVDQHYYDQLAESMRRQMRLLPVTRQPHSHERIVQEVVPFGSEFTPRGGYFTPEGINVPRSLRVQVADLRLEYSKNATIQRSRERVVPLSHTNDNRKFTAKEVNFVDYLIPEPEDRRAPQEPGPSKNRQVRRK